MKTLCAIPTSECPAPIRTKVVAIGSVRSSHRVVQILTNLFRLRTVRDSFHSHSSISFLNHTVRLENQLYEVDLALRGLEVRLRFDPWTLARVEVDYRGQRFGLARPVDRQLNSQLFGGEQLYEK